MFCKVELVGDEVENATDKIGDHDSDDDEPDNVIHIENPELVYDSLIITIFVLKLFQDSIEPRNIQQLDETWKPTQSKKFCHDTRVEEYLKREYRNKVNEKPSADVVQGNLFQVLDGLQRVWIRVRLQKVKEEVQVEHDFNGLVKCNNDPVLRLSESNI